jgi:hypothetical protein
MDVQCSDKKLPFNCIGNLILPPDVCWRADVLLTLFVFGWHI